MAESLVVLFLEVFLSVRLETGLISGLCHFRERSLPLSQCSSVFALLNINKGGFSLNLNFLTFICILRASIK